MTQSVLNEFGAVFWPEEDANKERRRVFTRRHPVPGSHVSIMLHGADYITASMTFLACYCLFSFDLFARSERKSL